MSDQTPAAAAAAAATPVQAKQAGAGKKNKPAGKQDKPSKEGGGAAAASASAAGKKDRSLLGLTTTREENFSEWYTQVLTKAELIEYYDISGCYVFRPASFSIWERIQKFFDEKIKASGVQNAYFPLLVSKAALEKEKSHIEGFSAEVAWVTKCGQSDIAEPVAIRPTSETVMYPCFAQWIRSHRDLPLRLNQWCNVLRWEFKHPVPFLRTREFLWQEGHSAFATKEEADKEVLEILDYYRQVYEDLLAVPVTLGRKSEGEKFAGGLYTTTAEAFIAASGRGIQGATSHCLGQNFSKMFNITYEDNKKERQFAWQNSWGLTTRTIGVAIMVHGDNKGLVWPPRVANHQAVVLPILFKVGDNASLEAKARDLARVLNDGGVRAFVDDREGYNPGHKFAHWEVRGVPLRIELGPKDMEAGHVTVVVRDTGDKTTIPFGELVERSKALLEAMHTRLFVKARTARDERRILIHKWEEFVPTLDRGCTCLAPWCGEDKCEEELKRRSRTESEARVKSAGQNAADESFRLTGAAKSLCTPFEQPKEALDDKCFQCGGKAQFYTLFGRSY